MALANQHRVGAELLLANASTRTLAFHSAGFACECALKAAIMRKERLNQWPNRHSRPELHVHDLKRLAKIVGMIIKPSDEVAPAWSVIVQWQRKHMYHADLNEIAAQQLFDAAFDHEKGVISWIVQNFL